MQYEKQDEITLPKRASPPSTIIHGSSGGESTKVYNRAIKRIGIIRTIVR